MGPVNLHISNNSGLSLLIMNSQAGNIGGCDDGGTFNYKFDSSFTNNTNSIRFYDPASPGNYTNVAGASWSGGDLDSIQAFNHHLLLQHRVIIIGFLSTQIKMAGSNFSLGTLWKTGEM
jgi:hypothetical protein